MRNLPDGRVELVVEGEVSELDRFQVAIQERLGDFIQRVECHCEPADQPPLEGFSIRY